MRSPEAMKVDLEKLAPYNPDGTAPSLLAMSIELLLDIRELLSIGVVIGYEDEEEGESTVEANEDL